MKLISTNNSILFTLLYKILYNSASKIYIFINSHITKTFRISFFSQKFYQRDLENDAICAAPSIELKVKL